MTKKTKTTPDLDNLHPSDRAELIELLEEMEQRKRYNKIDFIFPAKGKLARKLYPKQLEFFKAGATYKERAFIAGNRTGKTFGATYELVLHLTGLYPDWWEGRRFDHPIESWAAGQTNETTRDIVQKELLGMRGDYGSGMIPKECIARTTARPGVPDAVQDLYIKHKSGGISVCTLKSYVQGVESFMGTAKHVVWFDEEPPANVYSEALTRTMTTKGMIYCTFTPLRGLSDVVLAFLPDGKLPQDQEKVNG